jgi:hypothetical protein
MSVGCAAGLLSSGALGDDYGRRRTFLGRRRARRRAGCALRQRPGATETELIEAITHLAFYAGWPKATSAMAVAKQVFATHTTEEN